jgi:hypothetical protein
MLPTTDERTSKPQPRERAVVAASCREWSVVSASAHSRVADRFSHHDLAPTQGTRNGKPGWESRNGLSRE